MNLAQIIKYIAVFVAMLLTFSAILFWNEPAYPQANCSTVDQQIASLEKRKIPGVYTTKIISENGVPKALLFIVYNRGTWAANIAVFDVKGCYSTMSHLPNPMVVFELLNEAEKAALFLKTSSH